MAHRRKRRQSWTVVDEPRVENRAARRAELAEDRREARRTGQVRGCHVYGWMGKDPIVEVDVSGS